MRQSFFSLLPSSVHALVDNFSVLALCQARVTEVNKTDTELASHSYKPLLKVGWDLPHSSSVLQIPQAGGRAGCTARRVSSQETTLRRSELGPMILPPHPTCLPGAWPCGGSPICGVYVG